MAPQTWSKLLDILHSENVTICPRHVVMAKDEGLRIGFQPTDRDVLTREGDDQFLGKAQRGVLALCDGLRTPA